LSPNSPYYFFVKRDESRRKEYENFIQIGDILPVNVTGIVTARDKFVIDFDKKPLLNRIQDFCDLNKSDKEIQAKYRLSENYSWRVDIARQELAEDAKSDPKLRKCLQKLLYRPFDERYIFYHPSVVWRARGKFMHHMQAGENLALITSRMTKGERFKHAQVTRNIVEVICMSPKTSNNGFVFPLYLYPKKVDEKQGNFLERSHWPASKGGRVPNLDKDFVEKLAGKVKLEFVSDGIGDLGIKDKMDSRLRGNDKARTFGPEDIFHYIYAVFHSPEYRRRYAEFLKIDFPRVPLPKGKPLFVKLCKAGEKLVKLHLMEAEILEDENKLPGFDIEGDNVVEKGYPKYVGHADRPKKGKVYINKDQCFEGVRPDVWEFHIGGYQVCEKWLKDRRGRKLDYEDIRHYQRIAMALGETIKLMGQVDEVIESNGGWPMG